MDSVVIVSAARTPIGKLGGVLKELSAWELGAMAIQAVLQRAGIEADEVDEVIMGNVLQAGQGMNTARRAAVKSGISCRTPAYVVNKVCASGLKAVILGTQSLLLGDAEIIVAGGMESMSNAPYLLERARWGYRMGHDRFLDSMILDGLWCSLTDRHMGTIAENLAERFHISRDEQDAFSARSYEKATSARKEGKFRNEITPVNVGTKGEKAIIVDTDETTERKPSLPVLKKLPPAFVTGGTVTAGNSSSINDGAAAVILMKESAARQRGFRSCVRIEGYASVADDPDLMGLTPIAAMTKTLNIAGLSREQIDLFEIHETFAVSSILVNRELGVEEDKCNIHGGAIALGHPIGASGARILTTLVHALQNSGRVTGLSSICLGGGQAVAVAVRRI
jgi:acetyl-CoA C-acetyltransferase